MWKRPYKTRKLTAGLMRKLPKAQKGHVRAARKVIKGSPGLFPRPPSDLPYLLGQVTSLSIIFFSSCNNSPTSYLRGALQRLLLNMGQNFITAREQLLASQKIGLENKNINQRCDCDDSFIYRISSPLYYGTILSKIGSSYPFRDCW